MARDINTHVNNDRVIFPTIYFLMAIIYQMK